MTAMRQRHPIGALGHFDTLHGLDGLWPGQFFDDDLRRTESDRMHAQTACRRLTYLPKWEILNLMRVIAKSSLKNFWGRPGCGDARGPLHSWYDEAVKATWKSPQDVKDQYASASICGNNRVVFNVGGNKYRLVVEMQYRAGIVWVKFVGTHAQYDRIDVENVNDY